MPRPTRSTIDLVSNGTTYPFPENALEGFPDAQRFLDYLIKRGGLSQANTVYYVKLAAKLKRRGRLHHPDALQNRVDRTAARAYWSWVRETYDARVSPVLRAFANADVSRGARWLRVSSLVKPDPEKLLHYRPMPGAARPDQEIPAVRSERCPDLWTLHVPRAETIPHHTDPCIDQCTVVKITDPMQLEAIAVAFEKAWGHRDLGAVPPDAHLFGQPPLSERVQYEKPAQRVVALVKDGHSPVAGAIESIGGSSTNLPDVFAARLQMEQIADVAVIDFAAAPLELSQAILAAVQTAWTRWHATQGLPIAPRANGALPINSERFKPLPAWNSLPGRPQPAGLAIVPSIDALPLAPSPITSETFVPIDWAARDQVVHTRLVHCVIHKTSHTVNRDAAPCAEGAWTEIRA